MSLFCPPGGGMTENYLSIDDILMSSEKIPSSFQVSVKGLGFLDPSTHKKDIDVGTKMDLPLWLAGSLAHSRRKFITTDFTKPYKSTYREILKADASVVDLHKLGPHFYSFGQQLLTLEHGESILLAKTLVLAFSDRFRRIMDWSSNALGCDTSQRMDGLDEVERTLYRIGQKSLQSFHQWEVGQSRKLETSEFVSRHRKRKRDAVD
uniref:DNA replication complex GINS protein PSF3 n=1 Tax=Phallusia mammillata TaxID=59560 RepID=A0A6F9DBR0_9ASCI|nr:probable ATP-dependent RNA helicase DHX35 [Phallusia mammillata]